MVNKNFKIRSHTYTVINTWKLLILFLKKGLIILIEISTKINDHTNFYNYLTYIIYMAILFGESFICMA